MHCELPYCENPAFTADLLRRDLMPRPFTVVDVGVYGGEHPRWHAFGDALQIYGFDPREEAIRPLQERGPVVGQASYFPIAIGDEDGTREFTVRSDNPAESSFYSSAAVTQKRVVSIQRLDSLVAARRISAPHFLKVDVEGFEKHVLLSAVDCLGRSVIGVELETNFGASSVYPITHIGAALEILTPLGFRLAHLIMARHHGRPSIVDVLFCKEVSRDTPPEDIVRLAAILESYRLWEFASRILTEHGSAVSTVIDVDRALGLLSPSVQAAASPTADDVKSNSRRLDVQNWEASAQVAYLQRQIEQLLQSTSWRVTAPLRALSRVIRRSP